MGGGITVPGSSLPPMWRMDLSRTRTTANPGEPPMMPGTPNPSMAGEAFMDTPIVNGVAYPNLTVDPTGIPVPYPERCR